MSILSLFSIMFPLQSSAQRAKGNPRNLPIFFCKEVHLPPAPSRKLLRLMDLSNYSACNARNKFNFQYRSFVLGGHWQP